MTIGTWALSQVCALRNEGHVVQVVSPVPAIPKFISETLNTGTSSNCPSSATISGVPIFYPRWPLFPVGPLKNFVNRIPSLFVGFAWLFLRTRLKAITKDFSPDIIFCHHAAFGGYLGRKISIDFGIPYFVTDHSFGEIESCQSNYLRRNHYQVIVRDASKWFAVANRMRTAMETIFPDAAIRTIHNGAEGPPASVRLSACPKFMQGKTVVFVASFFYHRKNIPLLVSAFDSVAEDFPEAILVVAGSGIDEGSVVGRIGSSIHKEKMHFIGHLSHLDVLKHMYHSDIFVNPGVNEPFATTFSEAMMCGLPIIYSSDGGISDVVEDGVQGLAITPNSQDSLESALRRLIGDLCLRRSLGEAAFAMATSQLTWKRNALEILAEFEAVSFDDSASLS
jgi:glycosyltransferase involved in cell wall biosynthesis